VLNSITFFGEIDYREVPPANGKRPKVSDRELADVTERDVPWRLLGLGGAASLCCVGTSAIGGAAITSGAVAGGLGAGIAQILVTVVTVALVGLAWRWRRSEGDGT
jgi:hypothetical protein